MSKPETVKEICDRTGLTKTEVNNVLDILAEIAARSLSKGGPGTFIVRNLVRLKRIDKPEQPARHGINPFTKLEQDFPAKPASSSVKATVLKHIKDVVKDTLKV